VQTLHNYRLTCPAALCFRSGRPCTECVGSFFHGERFVTPAIVTAGLRAPLSRRCSLYIGCWERGISRLCM
jgi:hypothetical protein